MSQQLNQGRGHDNDDNELPGWWYKNGWGNHSDDEKRKADETERKKRGKGYIVDTL